MLYEDTRRLQNMQLASCSMTRNRFAYIPKSRRRYGKVRRGVERYEEVRRSTERYLIIFNIHVYEHLRTHKVRIGIARHKHVGAHEKKLFITHVLQDKTYYVQNSLPNLRNRFGSNGLSIDS